MTMRLADTARWGNELKLVEFGILTPRFASDHIPCRFLPSCTFNSAIPGIQKIDLCIKIRVMMSYSSETFGDLADPNCISPQFGHQPQPNIPSLAPRCRFTPEVHNFEQDFGLACRIQLYLKVVGSDFLALAYGLEASQSQPSEAGLGLGHELAESGLWLQFWPFP